MVMALITLKMMMLTLVRIAIVQVQVLWREESVEKAPSLRFKPSCLQKWPYEESLGLKLWFLGVKMVL